MARVALSFDNNLTRHRYREAGKYETFEVEKVFGSFTEAKRAAGLQHTRLQQQVLGQLARHAAHDELRKMTIERADYAEKYRKPTGRRFQTILGCNDVHDKEMDAFWGRVFLDTARRVQPDVIALNGDIYDLPEFGRYMVDPREWDVVGRIKAVHEFLEGLREACPDAEIVFIEGNHEARLLRHLAEASPSIQAVLADLHGFTVPKLLGLDTFEVRYVGRGNLAAFNKSDINRELEKNYEIFFNSVLAHHFPHGKNRGVPGWNGHHHKEVATPFFSQQYGPSMWHQFGCGHRREASYCEADLWDMGFGLYHVDAERQRSVCEYVSVKDFAVVGGQYYVRGADER